MSEHYIEVSIPKNAKNAKDLASALAFGLGSNGSKMAARFIDNDPCRYKGKKVICRAHTCVRQGSKGQPQRQIHLVPTNRKRPTHELLKADPFNFAPV